MSDFLRRFAQAFATLDKHNLHLLDSLYSKDIVFTDPLHEVHGLTPLHRLFRASCTVMSASCASTSTASTRWPKAKVTCAGKSSFCHPRLAKGKVIRVEGCSHLMWRDKVYRHRDYFDAGAMLYEHLPVFGRVISWLKRRVG